MILDTRMQRFCQDFVHLQRLPMLTDVGASIFPSMGKSTVAITRSPVPVPGVGVGIGAGIQLWAWSCTWEVCPWGRA